MKITKPSCKIGEKTGEKMKCFPVWQLRNDKQGEQVKYFLLYFHEHSWVKYFKVLCIFENLLCCTLRGIVEKCMCCGECNDVQYSHFTGTWY